MTRHTGVPGRGWAPPDGPVPPGPIEAGWKKPKAELQAPVRRPPQSETATIRYRAVSSCMARLPHGLSLSRFVIANLMAIAVAGVLALATASGEPPLLDALRDVFAPIVARLFAGP